MPPPSTLKWTVEGRIVGREEGRERTRVTIIDDINTSCSLVTATILLLRMAGKGRKMHSTSLPETMFWRE